MKELVLRSVSDIKTYAKGTVDTGIERTYLFTHDPECKDIVSFAYYHW
jgi:hypothetical protein